MIWWGSFFRGEDPRPAPQEEVGCGGEAAVKVSPGSWSNADFWLTQSKQRKRWCAFSRYHSVYFCVSFSNCGLTQTDPTITSFCQFRSVANWPLRLATELWLNFKVILINAILRKQWLYNVSGSGARTGRNIIQRPHPHHAVRIACVRDEVRFSSLVHKSDIWHILSFSSVSMIDSPELGSRWEVFSSRTGIRALKGEGTSGLKV